MNPLDRIRDLVETPEDLARVVIVGKIINGKLHTIVIKKPVAGADK